MFHLLWTGEPIGENQRHKSLLSLFYKLKGKNTRGIPESEVHKFNLQFGVALIAK